MGKNITSKILILIVLFLIAVFIYSVSSSHFDNKLNDLCIKIMTNIHKSKASDDIALIIVDDKSMERIAWPWSRNLYSDIFDYLENDCGAKVVVFQKLVFTPDTYNQHKDSEFYRNISDNHKLINSYILVNSSVGGDVLPSKYLKLFKSKRKVNIRDERTKKNENSYKAVIALSNDFLHSANNLGSSILAEDNDTVLRNYMPVVSLGDTLYPSIALSAFSLYSGITDFYLNNDYLCSDDGCKSLKIPVKQFQTRDYFGNFVNGIYSRLNWYKPSGQYYTHKKYSAIDVIDSISAFKSGEIPLLGKEQFNNKIVLVGVNADATTWEQLSETPILVKHADVDVHATMLNNMLDNKFINVSDGNSSLIIAVIFSLFIIFGFRNLSNNLIFASLLSLIYFIYYLIQFNLKLYIPPVTPILLIYTTAFLKKIYMLINTDKSVEIIKRAMGKYVSKDVMKKVLLDADKLKVGGVRAMVTILFVDIRNFTHISENISPQEVTNVLNEYFSVIEPIIAKYSGIINKYMGDGVLAIFGEPIKDEEHALNAIKCGLELKSAVMLLKEKFIREGKPKIEIGIGINTGEVFAGNIGTDDRLEYTVIGDNVNLAYRIEAYNQILKTQFLISQYTYEFVKDKIEVVKLSQVEIKGKSKPIDIYEVLKIKYE
ncbi:adenylate/guanylate cyclase domain-containing protein [bacterium]|nr:adenylate/guanylate cyclase domain-containing protein [bacterium]